MYLYLFKILSIRYGWFEVRIGQSELDWSDYLGYDAPKILLQAVINLTKNNSQEEWVCCMCEPCADILHIVKEKNEIKLELFDTIEESYEIDLNNMKPYCKKCYATYQMEWITFLDNLVTEFSLYENGNGLCLYQENWMNFPSEEFHILKDLARSMVKNKEDSELFFNTYMR